MFKNMTCAQRIELAKTKIDKVLDHFLYLLELHANNEFIVYSPALSSQIPKSYAANAFNVFQRSMHQIEIVRLCALWDSADLDKENIPAVVELIDDDNIIEELAEGVRAEHADKTGIVLNPNSDPIISAVERAAIHARFADDQAAKARTELKETIARARNILSSPRLEAILNIRDKHLAHSLTETKREKRGPVPPMTYGDGTSLLKDSIPIIERLFCWVNGASFSIKNSQEIDYENAKALWTECKFSVLR